MALGTKTLATSELDTFEDQRLLEEVRKAKEELFNLRFQSATGQLESHGRIRAVKRDIARLYTVIRERELGIRATPAPVETAPKAKKTKAAPASTPATPYWAGAAPVAKEKSDCWSTSAVPFPADGTASGTNGVMLSALK